MKNKIIATGLNGLVGSKIASDLFDKYDFERIDVSDPSNPIDITDEKQLDDFFSQAEGQFVVHLAAFTDVTKAWEQNGDEDGLAFKVNVLGTKNVVAACRAHHKHLIHISTAYVFDGNKSGLYTEDDTTNPIEWYGETKWRAEQEVIDSGIDWTILRIDQPFRSDNFAKMDIAHRIIAGIQSRNLYPQFIDHFFGPTYIDDFVKIVDWVIRTKTKGLFHASSGEKWSDYNFATLINQKLNLEGTVQKGFLDEYLKTLNRPYQKNTAMDCSKLKSEIDFNLSSIENAVRSIII